MKKLFIFIILGMLANTGHTTDKSDAMKTLLMGDWECRKMYIAADYKVWFTERWENLTAGCRLDPAKRGVTYSDCSMTWIKGGLWQPTSTGQATNQRLRLHFKSQSEIDYYSAYHIDYAHGEDERYYSQKTKYTWGFDGFTLNFSKDSKNVLSFHRISFEKLAVIDSVKVEDSISLYKNDNERISCVRRLKN